MKQPRKFNIVVRVTKEERARFTAILGRHRLQVSDEVRKFLERKVRRLERMEQEE